MKGNVNRAKDLLARLRFVASELFGSATLTCMRVNAEEDGSCIRAEAERPLTPAEKREGWVGRPFWAYDPDKLCTACRAYWHAELAAQALHEAICLMQKFGGAGEGSKEA